MSEQAHDEFNYRYPHNVFGHIPGAHTGTSLGTGDRFAGFADLFDYPDPRRLDLRASLRNNLSTGENSWLVRRYQQRSPITLWMMADLSRSMAISNVNHNQLANLTHLIAHSAIGLGDRFALAGFDSDLRRDVSMMPTRQRSMPLLAADMIRDATPAKSAGVNGLISAANMITSTHAIVFLASDFCCDIEVVDKAFRQLSRYTVIPIVWKHDDVNHLPSHAGWTEMRDAETGERRSVWMRPSIKKRWQKTMDEHFEQLTACFMRHRVRPLFAEGDVTGEQLTQYFLGRN
ncbi:MAG: VWA domain-containing protein [Gammaproteobacteria bacterium]|nr:VWA domain-containing protein [Gammaproteobacteria bacterium]